MPSQPKSLAELLGLKIDLSQGPKTEKILVNYWLFRSSLLVDITIRSSTRSGCRHQRRGVTISPPFENVRSLLEDEAEMANTNFWNPSLSTNDRAQWFPMCQFGFENYATQIRVQIQNFYEVNHLQLFSSHCPIFQPF